MSRPVNKTDLIAASQLQFEALISYIDQLSSKDKIVEFPAGTLNRNIRDVLGHLHHWHLMMMDWYNSGMAGKKPIIPAPGFTWKDTPALNLQIRDRYQTSRLEDVQQWLIQSHQQIQAIITNHSQEELFEKKKYGWTGSTSLGAYLVSATSSHYDWGLKLIRKCLRSHK